MQKIKTILDINIVGSHDLKSKSGNTVLTWSMIPIEVRGSLRLDIVIHNQTVLVEFLDEDTITKSIVETSLENVLVEFGSSFSFGNDISPKRIDIYNNRSTVVFS
tara:strand:- start:124 stop:438 length:315 start_codon:yes stop_codon:yes gene_type:complete